MHRIRPARHHRERERGQIIVLFALSVIALMGGVGLVIDGGGAFAQRRDEQNGADLAALAGANAYMNTPGTPATKSAAAIAAARAAGTRNGYTNGAGSVLANVSVHYLASGASVTVDVRKAHRNSFSAIIPGQATWDVSVTATAVAGTIDTAVGAAPWTMSIDAFNANGSPKYDINNPQDFGDGNGDYPNNELDIAWTDFNGGNNVNSSEVSGIISGSNVVTATFDFGQYLGQHNNGNHTTLYSDVDSYLSGHLVPVPIVGPGPCQLNGTVTGQPGGCFEGWAVFHVISADGGSNKHIRGYFTGNFKAYPMTVGECTPAQQANNQCGLIDGVTPFDNRVIRLTN